MKALRYLLIVFGGISLFCAITLLSRWMQIYDTEQVSFSGLDSNFWIGWLCISLFIFTTRVTREDKL